MKQYFIVFIILFILILGSCVGEKKSKYTLREDSELTLLMREMTEDVELIRKQILEGESDLAIKVYNQIHSSESTEPHKAKSDQYKIFADAYLNSISMLQNSDEEELQLHYGAMIESCMACHRAMCPGPMVRIEKLRLTS